MADFRQIHVLIWDDDWFCQLSSDEKVVFIWLFSNRRASVSGLYQFTEFICSRETGISLENVKKAIKRLVDDKKIYVEGEWVWVKNLRKYNYYKNNNADKRIQKDLDQLPDNGLRHAYIDYYKPLDSPSEAPTIPLLEQEQEQEHDIKNNNSSSGSNGSKPRPRPNIYSIYESEIGALTPFISDSLNEIDNHYPDGWFIMAVKEAKTSTTRVSLNYIKKILDRWEKEGLPNNYKKELPKNGKKTEYKESWQDGQIVFIPIEVVNES